jgi:hypothetical protein
MLPCGHVIWLGVRQIGHSIAIDTSGTSGDLSDELKTLKDFAQFVQLKILSTGASFLKAALAAVIFPLAQSLPSFRGETDQ